MKTYIFKGSETKKDLCELEEKGIISRNDHNVYSERYIDYLDAKIVYLGQEESYYNQEDFNKLTVAQKNMVRARLDYDWAECNFGENYTLVFNKNRDLERSYEEVA
tara:strand:+ start:45 stop:362 length:318 start_codon:yes stop_codon:yes gene_type:complete